MENYFAPRYLILSALLERIHETDWPEETAKEFANSILDGDDTQESELLPYAAFMSAAEPSMTLQAICQKLESPHIGELAQWLNPISFGKLLSRPA